MYFEGVVLAVFPAHQTILPAVVSYKARGECGLYLDSSTMLDISIQTHSFMECI